MTTDAETNLESLPTRLFKSYEDADLSLESSDGVTFRVDSIILRRASPFFASLLDPSSPNSIVPNDSNTRLSIKMEETAAVLDPLLCSIYPSIPPYEASDAEKAVSSLEFAIQTLRATDRLRLSEGHLGHAAAEHIGKLDPPIRAWCIAVKSGNKRAREVAVERFVGQKRDSSLIEDVAELEGMDGLSIVRLMNIRVQTQAYGAQLAQRFAVPTFCSTHRELWPATDVCSSPFAVNVLLVAGILDNIRKNRASSCANPVRGSDVCAGHYAKKADPDAYAIVLLRELDSLLGEARAAEAEGREVQKPSILAGYTWA